MTVGSQLVSIRIRQVNESNNNHINDKDSGYMSLPFDGTTSENNKCVILQPEYVNGGGNLTE